MRFAIYNEEATRAGSHQDDCMERGVWMAVLMQAVEDFRSGNLRRQRLAGEFFFASPKDLATVCRAAGFDAASVLGKMRNMERAVLRVA